MACVALDRPSADRLHVGRLGREPPVLLGDQGRVPFEGRSGVDIQAVRLDHARVDHAWLDLDARREDPGGSGGPRHDPKIGTGF